MRVIRRSIRIAVEAFRHFSDDDGWAIASHIALSALMSIFPFFLVLTALAGMFGSATLPEEAANLILESWPKEVSGPIAVEIHSVLRSARGQVLTVGVALALFFASSGIESLRIGLNRAYNVVDPRSMWIMRLESIAYVLVAAVGMLALSFLVLLAPLLWATAVRYAPALEPFGGVITLGRYVVASIILIVALVVVHLWLPAGRRTFKEVAPGIVATLVLWLATGALFGRYLAEFAFTYSVYYAGLASPMIALVFLYFTASIFVYGGELNAVIRKAREQ